MPEETLSRFGVLQVPIDPGVRQPFVPKSARSMPQGELATVHVSITAQTVAAFNRSQTAKDRKRLAVLTDHGILFLNDIGEERRPKDPEAFPTGTERTSSLGEARQIAAERNCQVLSFARVPRVWTVVVIEPAAVLSAGRRDSIRISDQAARSRIEPVPSGNLNPARPTSFEAWRSLSVLKFNP